MNKATLIVSTLVFVISCAHKPNTQPTSDVASPASPSVKSDASLAKPTPGPQQLLPRGIDFGATIKTVAFGSSANQDLPQPIWKAIAANKPDLFLFMGDNVRLASQEPRSVAAQYRKLDLIPEYRAFRESVPFLATWDNDDQSEQKDFVKYWSYVGNSTTFGQKGIYHAKVIGPKNRQVQIIMLDTRTFRTKPDASKATLLGDLQWAWLEDQLKRPAQVRMIVSSIPLIAGEQGTDKWSLYPQERQRFLDLLRKSSPRNVVVFSGDRRQSSIAKTAVKDWGILFDVTASPINGPLAAATEDASFEGKAYAGESFGYAQIDWHDKRMNLQVRDASNKMINSVSFKIK